jgi:hypothetical protein
MSNSKDSALPTHPRLARFDSTLAPLSCFAWELLGSLVMLVVLNFFALWYLGNYSTNYGYWTLHQKWSILGKMESPVEWLILGDSSCNQGVSPAVITERLGGAAVNLCTIGNVTLLNDLWMLEEYIQRFGPPKAVVVIHVYDIYPRELSPVILGQIPRPWGFWRQHTLGRELLDDPQIRSELFQEHFIPLLSQRLSLDNILRALIFEKLVPFREQWHMEEDGFLMDEQARPETATQDGKDHMQFVRESEPVVSEVNQASLRALRDIADAHQIPIYIVNSPLYEDLYADEQFRVYLEQIHAQIEAAIGQSEYMHLLTEVKTFPASQLQTADHLVVSGALAYTDWLVQNVLSR